MSTSFLQSKEWLNFQKSLKREVFEYDQDGIKAGIIKLPLWFGRSYLYIPHGPAMDFNAMIGGENNPVQKFLQHLKALAKKEKAIFIKIEPLIDHVAQVLAERKFKKSKREIQPSRTVILDLGLSEEELKDKMHHKTRYNIGLAEKHGVEVRESQDYQEFWELMKKTTKRDKFFSHSRGYYEKLLTQIHGGEMWTPNEAARARSAPLPHTGWTKMFTAYHQGKPLASAIVLFYDGVGYYLHGASDYGFRKMMAPYKLHWEIIKYLKSQAFKKYDLWGIDAKHWPGVMRFKLGWQGRVVEYPGSFDWVLSWWWYQSYKIARKVF